VTAECKSHTTGFGGGGKRSTIFGEGRGEGAGTGGGRRGDENLMLDC